MYGPEYMPSSKQELDESTPSESDEDNEEDMEARISRILKV